ncbi:K+ efflux antiporter 5 [Actinidia rufa]|uniref:K+ efflux antiporter 5 n=1 Tax=Actinidia rufa TaxID=165716 RepID=A0A7J0E632_9ERIC|nr:K+ efflux antiporter 5 [Actinidia rufa]
MAFCAIIADSARSDQDIRERFYGNLSLNSSSPNTDEGSIAKIFDRVLEKEFSENDQPEGSDGSSFNSSVADQQVVNNDIPPFDQLNNCKDVILSRRPTNHTKKATLDSAQSPLSTGRNLPHSQYSSTHRTFPRGPINRSTRSPAPPMERDVPHHNTPIPAKAELETVAKITHEKGKKNESQAANSTSSFHFNDVFSLENEGSDDMTTLIDKKDNVFVMSNKKSKYPVLQVDLRLISDLVVVVVSAAIGGIIFSCIGQPVIVGYLLAGSIIGPGGLNFISEMVQVETVAQFWSCLPSIRSWVGVLFDKAVLGGLLQIAILMFLCGTTAMLCGAKLSEGIFVGCFLSMSSTAVAAGLVHISLCGICIDLVFRSSLSQADDTAIISGKQSLFADVGTVVSIFPRGQIDKLGLSLELGSFVAGVMISTTDFAQRTLDQVEPIRNLFAALFLSSIGMIIHVQFLWIHVDILLASVILVVVVKTTFAAMVTKIFGYSAKTSFLVGVLLAQIGEFAFVLLSRASNLHLVEGKMYLLLLGTTALSLEFSCAGFPQKAAIRMRAASRPSKDVPCEAPLQEAAHGSTPLHAPQLGFLKHRSLNTLSALEPPLHPQCC